MHVVIWTASGQRYAVEARQVVEIVPLVDARPIAHSIAWIRGLMNFRGRLIPLLDMATLLGGAACEARMSCRILVVRMSPSEPPRETLVGLAIEQLIGVEQLDFSAETAHPGLEGAESDFLGPVAWTESGAVQLLCPDRLAGWQNKIGTVSSGVGLVPRPTGE